VRLLFKEGRGYIPSRIDDNPHLNAAAYRDSLSHLPPVEREQLLSGDWNIQPDGVFKAHWLRYYLLTPGHVELLRADGRSVATLADEPRSFDRFMTIDPAGTPAEEARRAKSREPSWSVIQVWDQPRQYCQFLLLREQWRERVGFTDLCDWIGELARSWRVKRIYVEHEHTGRAIISHFENTLRVTAVPTGNQSKKARSIPLQEKMSAGEVFLPKNNNSWLRDFEAELLAWTGDERQPADQIDAAAYAAIIAQRDHHGGAIRLL
jgi:phage terminase large subunit-like protein